MRGAGCREDQFIRVAVKQSESEAKRTSYCARVEVSYIGTGEPRDRSSVAPSIGNLLPSRPVRVKGIWLRSMDSRSKITTPLIDGTQFLMKIRPGL